MDTPVKKSQWNSKSFENFFTTFFFFFPACEDFDFWFFPKKLRIFDFFRKSPSVWKKSLYWGLWIFSKKSRYAKNPCTGRLCVFFRKIPVCKKIPTLGTLIFFEKIPVCQKIPVPEGWGTLIFSKKSWCVKNSLCYGLWKFSKNRSVWKNPCTGGLWIYSKKSRCVKKSSIGRLWFFKILVCEKFPVLGDFELSKNPGVWKNPCAGVLWIFSEKSQCVENSLNWGTLVFCHFPSEKQRLFMVYGHQNFYALSKTYS